MLNFNRRDGTPDPKSGIKAPLKPAHYDPPETPARMASTPTRPSMPSAPASGNATAVPALNDAVGSAPRQAQPAATPAAAITPTQMTATAGGSTLSVGINIHLKGVEISNCDALVIEGQVEATVHSKTMQIEKPGTLSGTAVIDVAEIHGEFSGELTARTRLVVHGTGRVSGTIRYGKLIVAEGGELTGDIKQLDGSEGDAQVPLLKPDWRHQSSTPVSSGSTSSS
ncbi:MAG: polymer-forming cytoskeletal protein [Betaproteobacteria bacterium]